MKRYHPLPLGVIGACSCKMSECEDGDYVEYEEAQSTITALQAQLAERDKTILEQQARIVALENFVRCVNSKHYSLFREFELSALEAALKAERIKCLEDAAETCYELEHGYECHDQLYRMANELKEQK